MDKTIAHPFIRAYAFMLAVATFLLVIAGGLVTSTGSGLAVPDWPLSFGQVFPPMVGGVFYEHGHRMIAATIGLLTVLLAVVLARNPVDHSVRKLGYAAVGVVILQGCLGGLTVLLGLPALVSVAHATLGQIFFCLIVSIALLVNLHPLTASLPLAGADRLRRLAVLTTAFVLIQLILGATYRHSGKLLHLHIVWAIVVAAHAVLLGRRVLRQPELESDFRVPALSLLTLVGLQIVLGVYSWQLPMVWITTTHLAAGALILATCVMLTVLAYRRVRPA
jgi:heme a synthase